MQSWDDLRYFLALQRHGKLASAGRSLSVDYTTVGRRVKELESVLKTKLFEKKDSGFEVTSAGQVLLGYAESIERTVLGIEEGVTEQAKDASGKVRISSPAEIGNYFLAGNLPHLLKDYPGLEIDLSSGGNAADLSRRKVDVMLTTQRPSDESLVVRRITDFSIGLFSSEQYLNENSKIEKTGDLRGHKLIVCDEDSALKKVVDGGPMSACQKIPFISCSVVALYKAMTNGCGLCLLPCFIEKEYHDLVRVLKDDIVINKTLWLVVNQDMKHIPRVKVVSDFIADTLCGNKF